MSSVRTLVAWDHPNSVYYKRKGEYEIRPYMRPFDRAGQALPLPAITMFPLTWFGIITDASNSNPGNRAGNEGVIIEKAA